MATACPALWSGALIGVDAWLGSWEFQPGESVPGKVDEAPGVVDTVMVFRSADAAASAWVNTEEWRTAITRPPNEDVRLIPVILDETRSHRCSSRSGGSH
ncbi:toll/interleukin-1 receptor domain-containing protein [Streptomyces sp. NPDC014995]|uniref:toll/interleukin-1 receptor domain-containing protein n=1 Tax=Streptomyces sp. NPDC014995 TaxID=3364936 RepID=UPI0036FA5057